MNARSILLTTLCAVTVLLTGCAADTDSGPPASSSPAATSAVATSTTAAASDPIIERIPSPFTTDPQVRDTYLGAVDGSDAYIAVVVADGRAVAFVCDGEQLWAWLTGTVTPPVASLTPDTAGKLELSGPDGGRLTGELRDGAVTGTVTLAGVDGGAFTARPAAADEGVYRAAVTKDGQPWTLGWILRADGMRGLLRSGPNSSAGISADRDDRRDDRRRREQAEANRCAKLASDLASAQATLDWLTGNPNVTPNKQAILLQQQRIARLQAQQC